MTPFTSFRINKRKVTHQTIDGEAVIINLDSGNYYSLDKVGADVWNAIERGVSVSDIVESVANLYEGDHVDIENAVTQLIAELQQENLVEPDQSEVTGSIIESGTLVATKPSSEKRRFEAPTLQKYTDMQDLLLLDPIHDVDETGWPNLPEPVKS